MSQHEEPSELAEFEVSDAEFDARMEAAEPAVLVAPPISHRGANVVIEGNHFIERPGIHVGARS